jgi:ribosomal protein S12 methylthiotransferase accessory factor
MGITRIAVLTGLDVLGIPVAAAVRPNSRSIAVHQGKGVTLSAAKASALMEAVETHHAETMALPLRLASFAELAPDAADPMLLPRWPAAAGWWCPSTSAVSGS